MNIGNTSPANELEILRAWRLLNEQPKSNQTQNAVNKNIIYDLEQWPQKDTAHKIKRNVTFVPMIQPFPLIIIQQSSANERVINMAVISWPSSSFQ